MIKSKSIEALRSFSVKELKDFGKFIKSPFFNNKKEVIRLFEAIKKYYPGFNSADFIKENIFKKLYPGVKYNDNRMRLLFSELLELEEEYISYVSYSSHKKNKYEYLLPELDRRKLDSLFIKNLKFFEEEFSRSREIPEQTFFNRYTLNIIKKNFLISRLEKGEDILEAAEKRSGNFILHILIKLIEQALEYRTAEDLYKKRADNNLISGFIRNTDLNEIVQMMNESSIENKELAAMYYTMYLMITKEEDKYYFELKELLNENYGTLSQNWRFSIYLKMLDFCVIKSRTQKSNNRYDREQHELRKFMIEKGIYSFAGKTMNPNFYRNTVTNAITIKEYNWAASFMEKAKALLPEPYGDNLYNYSLALLAFEDNNFEKALEYAAKVKLTHFILKLDIKVLMLKIYYELNMTESSISSIDSFRKFINLNKSIPEVFRERHRVFIEFYNELIKFKTKENHKEAGMLKREIETLKGFKDDMWILEKAEKLKRAGL